MSNLVPGEMGICEREDHWGMLWGSAPTRRRQPGQRERFRFSAVAAEESVDPRGTSEP